MKTLSLSKLDFGAFDVLEREQLKTIFGGDAPFAGGACGSSCTGGTDCSGSCPQCDLGTNSCSES